MKSSFPLGNFLFFSGCVLAFSLAIFFCSPALLFWPSQQQKTNQKHLFMILCWSVHDIMHEIVCEGECDFVCSEMLLELGTFYWIKVLDSKEGECSVVIERLGSHTDDLGSNPKST